MNTVTCRVIPERDQSVWRDIELCEDNTLFDLHLAIQRAFDLDNDHPYLFFTNNRVWDRVHVYGEPDGASTRSAYDAEIGPLCLPLNKRFMYLFDFGDELRHEVKVIGHGTTEAGVEYPRVVGAEGKPPPQYPSWDGDALHDGEGERGDVEPTPQLRGAEAEAKPNPALAALVPDVREALAGRDACLYPHEFEDEGEVATRRVEDVLRERDLARALLEHSGSDADAICVHIEYPVDGNVWPWLNRLPRELGDHGLAEDGADLALALYEARRTVYLAYELPLVLARAGRRDEALARLEENLLEDPEEARMLFVAGEAFEELGSPDRAETCYRDGLAWAGSNMDLRRAILVALERLLTVVGRPEAFEDLLNAERRLQDKIQVNRARAMGLIGPPTVRRETPKVGRNAPCPCGSGKKFKKCCGSPAATARA